jgi:hypothetical protein
MTYMQDYYQKNREKILNDKKNIMKKTKKK